VNGEYCVAKYAHLMEKIGFLLTVKVKQKEVTNVSELQKIEILCKKLSYVIRPRSVEIML